jgi:hypothetical protein
LDVILLDKQKKPGYADLVKGGQGGRMCGVAHAGRLIKAQASHPVAFTLVELLVVIGIIGALIAVLIPVLNRARAAANRTVCLSNIRQLGVGILMYCNENKGWFPTCAYWDNSPAYRPYPEDWIHWQANRNLDDSAIAKYLGRGEALKRILRCPADNLDGRRARVGIEPGQGPYLYSYSMNERAAINAPNGGGIRTKLELWRSPSRKILITENLESFSTCPVWNYGSLLARRHGKGVSRGNYYSEPGWPMGINVSAAFMDSHAEPVNDDFALSVYQGRWQLR